MYALKRSVAYQVKEQVRMLNNSLLSDGTKLEVLSVDDLNTQVRVKSSKGYGPRYFLVKVSEQI